MAEYQVDFVVVGAGIAGLSAAKTLAEFGQVAVLMKGPMRESSTAYAQGGIAVALEQGDTPHFHLEDTLAAGDGLCNSAAVRRLVEKGPECVNELIRLGADFDRLGDQFHYTREAAHSRRRILHAGDATGKEIEKTLGNYLVSHPNVRFFSNTIVTQLLVDDKGCYGVIAVCNNEVLSVVGRSVILATGGLGQLFSYNTNPPVSCGDGIALALNVGARVQDLEFIQFHPTTLYTGDKKPISIFLISEAVRGEGAILRNVNGDRFMLSYDSRAELAPRDVVSRSIHAEMQRTNSAHVYLDLSAVDGEVSERFPTIFSRCLESNIDIRQDFIPVAPAAHYAMGGIQTDLNGQTDVTGLYAIGEVGCMGIHGANRLASNSLLDGLVFGYIAAQHALTQSFLKRAGCTEYEQKIVPLNENQKAKTKTLRNRVRSVMWQNVGIVRDQACLDQAIDTLSQIQEEASTPILNPAWMELQQMATIGQLIARFALARTESRGAHFRSDFPVKNDLDWQHHLVYRTGEPIKKLKSDKTV